MEKDLQIIGIGASAGGLEALEIFFNNCPVDTNLTFVVIQHLSPDYKSMMPELLSRRTKMKVRLAESASILQPNHVYLIPGNKNIVLNGAKLELQDRAPINRLNLPIDLFFESLARERKDKAIGIILSGTGSDGTKGAKAIKEAGGTIFVQDPQLAKFDGMALSIITNDLADFSLPVQNIPQELLHFISFPDTIEQLEQNDSQEKTIKNILIVLKENLDRDFFSIGNKP